MAEPNIDTTFDGLFISNEPNEPNESNEKSKSKPKSKEKKSYKLKDKTKTKKETVKTTEPESKPKEPESKEPENDDPNIEIKNCDGIEYLATIQNNSIDLILTDPPYIISRDSGMDKHYNMVKENEENNIEYIKTEAEWEAYKLEKGDIADDSKKENYMKYGSIYGKKYCVKTQYGDWDNDFTMDKLKEFISEY